MWRGAEVPWAHLWAQRDSRVRQQQGVGVAAVRVAKRAAQAVEGKGREDHPERK